MDAPIIWVYLLKANAMLVLFAAAYCGLLRRLTFFGLSRVYLLLALLFAAVYPVLPVPPLLPTQAPAPLVLPTAWESSLPPAQLLAAAPLAAPPFDWLALALWLYMGGVTLLLGRLLVQLLALARLRRATRPATTPSGTPYRQLPAPGDPFSFGRTIYLHAEDYSAAELAVVVAHEQAHVRQGHTLDVLLAHVATAFCWPNPAAWLLRRVLLDNLEYLADAATLRTGLDRRAYQYYLLRRSQVAAGPALALPFTFFTLKNRVAMMNRPISSAGQLAHYFLAGPLVVLAALGYSAAHARPATPRSMLNLAPAFLPTATLSQASASKPLPTSAPASAGERPASAMPKAAAPTLPLAARLYLASTYPEAKIMELILGRPTTAAPLIYVVKLVQGQKTWHPFFDATGRYLGEKEGAFKLYGPMSFFPLPTRPAKLGGRPAAATARAQTSPDPLYYLDGQVITLAQFKALDQNSIADVQVLKGERARLLTGDAGHNGVVVITTEANKNTVEVVEFNQQVLRLISLPAPLTTADLPADALYYLDGQPSTRQAVEQLDTKSISSIDLVKDQARIRRIPGLRDSPATLVMLVTTKANAVAPAVQAFTNQADLASGYTFRPVGVNVLVPAALAYITSHYPNARLNEVNERKNKANGVISYQVQLINGKRPFYVYFSPQGDFLSGDY